MRIMNRIKSVILLLLVSLTIAGQEMSVAERNAAQGFNDTIDRMAEDFVTASLLVTDPGNILYSVLGHACLRLQCPTFNLDYIFSYESEGVEGKVFRFLINDLKMGMTALDLDEYLQPYIEEKRGVREYILNLPPEVKSELWRMCDERLAQGMMLEYDPVERGCAISVMHSVEDAIKSANEMTGKHYKIDYPAWGTPFDRTLREIFYDNAPHGWGLFWCMTIVGGIVDKPQLPKKEKLICPQELADTWQRCTIDGQNMISEPIRVICEGNPSKTEAITPLYVSLAVLVLALLAFLMKLPYIDWAILGVQSLLGCLILWLLIAPLPATGWTWLIIPFNPLPLLCWYWRRFWALPYAAVIIAWCAAMLASNLWWHILVEPAHIVLALAFSLVLLKQSPRFMQWIKK